GTLTSNGERRPCVCRSPLQLGADRRPVARRVSRRPPESDKPRVMGKELTTYERVLVTGTSGFIAGHLAGALVTRGYRVMGVDIVDPPRPVPHVRYLRGDLRDPEVIAGCLHEFAPDVVLHLA